MFTSHSRTAPQISDADVNMTPLIDMVFILLIFFLVTATFQQDLGVKIQRAAATQTSPVSGEALRIAITENGQVFVNGHPAENRDLQREVRKRLAANTAAAVAIVPDRRTDAGRLIEIMDLVKGEGVTDVAVVTQSASH